VRLELFVNLNKIKLDAERPKPEDLHPSHSLVAAGVRQLDLQLLVDLGPTVRPILLGRRLRLSLPLRPAPLFISPRYLIRVGPEDSINLFMVNRVRLLKLVFAGLFPLSSPQPPGLLLVPVS
jgi:hypothetical protein